jgi:hypothetical protein
MNLQPAHIMRFLPTQLSHRFPRQSRFRHPRSPVPVRPSRRHRHSDQFSCVTVVVSVGRHFLSMAWVERFLVPRIVIHVPSFGVHPTSRARVSTLAQANGTAVAKLCREHKESSK